MLVKQETIIVTETITDEMGLRIGRHSPPKDKNKKNIFILPILINAETMSVNLFSQNPFFENWKTIQNKHF